MKVRLLLILGICASTAYAESWPLPPVVDNATYPAAPAANTTPSASAKTLYEMMGRLEQLQVEVQQLTGKVEEQTHQINELKKRQNTMYSDFDERIQSIESKAANVGESSAAENTAEESAEPPVAETKEKPVTPPAPPAPAAAPAKPPQAPQKPEPAQVAGDEKQIYQHAYEALRNGHTSQSIAEFDAFLAKYPASGLANNAQYWLGEAHRVNQDVESARKAFNKVIDNYPGGAKVPDALLKLGYIELEQNNPAKAREYLTRVTAEYPGTAAAHLAAKKLGQVDGSSP